MEHTITVVLLFRNCLAFEDVKITLGGTERSRAYFAKRQADLQSVSFNVVNPLLITKIKFFGSFRGVNSVGDFVPFAPRFLRNEVRRKAPLELFLELRRDRSPGPGQLLLFTADRTRLVDCIRQKLRDSRAEVGRLGGKLGCSLQRVARNSQSASFSPTR